MYYSYIRKLSYSVDDSMYKETIKLFIMLVAKTVHKET